MENSVPPFSWYSVSDSEENLGARSHEVSYVLEKLRSAVDDLATSDSPNNLGNALATLGNRESGTERLEQAVTTYTESLKERTRERVPLDWAMTQNNLGAALTTLGERESRTERLEQAVTAYTEALKEYTRERVSLGWAMTQNNLGNALATPRQSGERDRAP